MEGKSNIILVVVLIAIVVGVIVYAQKQKAKPTTTATDKDKTKPPTTTTPTTKPPTTPPKPKVESKCWKRHTGETETFSFPLTYEAEVISTTFVTKMMEKGNTDDQISAAAAFLKGMDLPLTFAKYIEYKKEFDAFKKVMADDIIRRSNFTNEVRDQVFNPRDLVCEEGLIALAFLR
jgi:heme-binding NEAT domain protein